MMMMSKRKRKKKNSGHIKTTKQQLYLRAVHSSPKSRESKTIKWILAKLESRSLMPLSSSTTSPSLSLFPSLCACVPVRPSVRMSVCLSVCLSALLGNFYGRWKLRSIRK